MIVKATLAPKNHLLACLISGIVLAVPALALDTHFPNWGSIKLGMSRAGLFSFLSSARIPFHRRNSGESGLDTYEVNWTLSLERVGDIKELPLCPITFQFEGDRLVSIMGKVVYLYEASEDELDSAFESYSKQLQKKYGKTIFTGERGPLKWISWRFPEEKLVVYLSRVLKRSSGEIYVTFSRDGIRKH